MIANNYSLPIFFSPLLYRTVTASERASPAIFPSDTILPKVCASKACLTALTTLKGLGFGDCSVVGVKLETDLIGPIDKACNAPAPAVAPTSSPTT